MKMTMLMLLSKDATTGAQTAGMKPESCTRSLMWAKVESCNADPNCMCACVYVSGIDIQTGHVFFCNFYQTLLRTLVCVPSIVGLPLLHHATAPECHIAYVSAVVHAMSPDGCTDDQQQSL